MHARWMAAWRCTPCRGLASCSSTLQALSCAHPHQLGRHEPHAAPQKLSNPFPTCSARRTPCSRLPTGPSSSSLSLRYSCCASSGCSAALPPCCSCCGCSARTRCCCRRGCSGCRHGCTRCGCGGSATGRCSGRTAACRPSAGMPAVGPWHAGREVSRQAHGRRAPFERRRRRRATHLEPRAAGRGPPVWDAHLATAVPQVQGCLRTRALRAPGATGPSHWAPAEPKWMTRLPTSRSALPEAA